MICWLSIGIGVAIVKRAPLVYLLSTVLISTVLDDWSKHYTNNPSSKQFWEFLAITISILGSIAWLVAWYRSSRKKF